MNSKGGTFYKSLASEIFAIKEGRLNEFGINLCSLLIKGSRTVAKKCGNYVYRGRSCGRLIAWEGDKMRVVYFKIIVLILEHDETV